MLGNDGPLGSMGRMRRGGHGANEQGKRTPCSLTSHEMYCGESDWPWFWASPRKECQPLTRRGGRQMVEWMGRGQSERGGTHTFRWSEESHRPGEVECQATGRRACDGGVERAGWLLLCAVVIFGRHARAQASSTTSLKVSRSGEASPSTLRTGIPAPNPSRELAP